MEAPEDQARKMQADADERIRQYQDLRRDVESMHITAKSADKSVTVTVAPGGAVTDLQLSQQAMRHGPGNLAALIMSTMAEAGAEAARQMAERVSTLTGPKIDVMGLVQARLPELDPLDGKPGGKDARS
ncbi:hypothetical protein BTM25_12260 [Actinomadura rubteroloni]|uniref:YbaB/EbfC family nucleoid-associated protein n=1 Tax=Actinomadura rubteroloni TaxID=1926885 RepID=A0A2P4UP47_9ACTN|nr:YbaB/EbfC family nucleoid-associated protein [Actinomadura rubteroloni]POM26818.1 hypothetical protein BTM25_12260 [Actinomadura rubteroloni]